MMDNNIEWTVKVAHNFQAINLYTAGAWMFGDEADETNTINLDCDLSIFQSDYERGIVEPLHAEVEQILNKNGFSIIGSWNGLINKAMRSV